MLLSLRNSNLRCCCCESPRQNDVTQNGLLFVQPSFAPYLLPSLSLQPFHPVCFGQKIASSSVIPLHPSRKLPMPHIHRPNIAYHRWHCLFDRAACRAPSARVVGFVDTNGKDGSRPCSEPLDRFLSKNVTQALLAACLDETIIFVHNGWALTVKFGRVVDRPTTPRSNGKR